MLALILSLKFFVIVVVERVFSDLHFFLSQKGKV